MALAALLALATASPAAELDDEEALLQLLMRRAAANGVMMPMPLDPQGAAGGEEDPFLPGRAVPERAAEAGVWRVAWHDYVTLIVVCPGTELRRTAWVATMERASGELQVAYHGSAFVDLRGDLHIDCRGWDTPQMRGSLADQWSPDSFAIEADGDVRVLDDNGNGSLGKVLEHHVARERDGRLSAVFRREWALARWYVSGVL
jgi:hypothetical protein